MDNNAEKKIVVEFNNQPEYADMKYGDVKDYVSQTIYEFRKLFVTRDGRMKLIEPFQIPGRHGYLAEVNSNSQESVDVHIYEAENADQNDSRVDYLIGYDNGALKITASGKSTEVDDKVEDYEQLIVELTSIVNYAVFSTLS